MTEIQIFTNDQFGQIRTIEQNGEPWFAGADIAKALGYANTKDAILTHVDDDDRRLVQRSEIATFENHLPKEAFPFDFVTSDIPNRGLTFINESGVYSLVFASKLPAAKQFKHWVTSEVLPALRKHQVYATPEMTEKILNDPDFLIKSLEALKQERQKNQRLTAENAMQTQQIAEMKPKVSYYDIVLQCKTLIKTSAIAKDYGMAAKEFNKLLRKLGVQYKQGDIWLLYSKYQNEGYTCTKTNTYNNGVTGEIGAKPWMYWTQKGRLFLYDLLKQNGILPLIERDNNDMYD